MGIRSVRVVVAGCAALTLISACSSGSTPAPPPGSPSATQSASPTFATSPSPTSSAASFKVRAAGWEFTLEPATAPPEAWPSDIPAPDEGVLQASGTGEPTFTASDHPIVAVQYMAPGEVAQVRSAQTAAMKAEGWKAAGKDHGADIFIKGNNSARIAVVENASTGGVTVYQWT